MRVNGAECGERLMSLCGLRAETAIMDTLAVVLKVGFYFAGTCALVSLAVYSALAYSGTSRILYRTVDQRLGSKSTNVFFALAAIAFLVCMYQGAEAMLGWMPTSWGHVGEDGEYETVAHGLAFMFALFVGGSLAGVLDKATHNAFFVQDLSDECRHLTQLLEASLDDRWLDSLRTDLEEKVAKIESERGRTDSTSHLWPEGQRRQRYRQLISLAERQQERLRQRAHASAITQGRIDGELAASSRGPSDRHPEPTDQLFQDS